jgi:hypothetical protein
MVLCNFKCNKCGMITEFAKQTVVEDFPSSVKCSHCGELDTYRIWGVGDIDVGSGILGNSKNNYERNISYMAPQKYGKFKGTTMRTIK